MIRNVYHNSVAIGLDSEMKSQTRQAYCLLLRSLISEVELGRVNDLPAILLFSPRERGIGLKLHLEGLAEIPEETEAA